MILFLKKSDRPAETATDASGNPQVEHQWEPSIWGGMSVSVLWIDGNKPFGSAYSLRKLKTVGCKDVVIEFRDFWRSLPQLEDKSGLNQMSEACDKILREMP